MLSRVANALFWMARYLERGEHVARLVGVTSAYSQELRGAAPEAASTGWDALLKLLGSEPVAGEAGYQTVHRLLFDREESNSIINCVELARENARGIRDALSSEMWETLNVLHLRVQEAAPSAPSEAADLSMLQAVRNGAHLFQGLRDNTLRQGDEWRFLCLGQFMERADATTRTLEAMYLHPALELAEAHGYYIDNLHLGMTLRCVTAYEAFNRSGHTLSPERVASFMLLENDFPRSVESCLARVGDSLHELSGTPASLFSNPAEQLCGRVVARLRFASIQEILAGGF